MAVFLCGEERVLKPNGVVALWNPVFNGNGSRFAEYVRTDIRKPE